MATSLFAGMLSTETDTDVLFEKFTIEQIREIEKKTRYYVCSVGKVQNIDVFYMSYTNH